MDMHKKESIWMSYILRHGAEKEGVPIDSNGWVFVHDLIEASKKAKKIKPLNFELIKEIVDTDSKQRYQLNEFKTPMIRASQGHSLNVDVELKSAIPPKILYHGTALSNLQSILKAGIQKQTRNYVHLSKDLATAAIVGRRHGEPIIFKIDTAKMIADGIQFWISANEVWLVDCVDPKYFYGTVMADQIFEEGEI